MPETRLSREEVLGPILMERDSRIKISPEVARARWESLTEEAQRIRLDDHNVVLQIAYVSRFTNDTIDAPFPLPLSRECRDALLIEERVNRVMERQAQGQDKKSRGR